MMPQSAVQLCSQKLAILAVAITKDRCVLRSRDVRLAAISMVISRPHLGFPNVPSETEIGQLTVLISFRGSAAGVDNNNWWH